MDVCDRAQDLEQRHRDRALRAVIDRPHGGGATHCRRCGRAIPAERLAVKPDAETCVVCQEIEERERR